MGGRPRTDQAKPPAAGSASAPKRTKAKPAAAPASRRSKAPPAPEAAVAAAATPAPVVDAVPVKAAPAKKPKATKVKAAPAEVAPAATDVAVAPKKAKPGKAAAAVPAALAGIVDVEGDAGAEDAPVAADAGDDDPTDPVIPRAPRPPPPFARTSGAPALGFPADKRPAPRWEFTSGTSFTLPLGVRSTGGVGKGVIVELSGAAIADGLYEASDLVFAGTRAKFQPAAAGVLRAKLDATEIPIGVQVPISPPPRDEIQRDAARKLMASTHIELAIEGRGSRTGTALLSVAARPATGPSAPLKWTRPISFK